MVPSVVRVGPPVSTIEVGEKPPVSVAETASLLVQQDRGPRAEYDIRILLE
jgi:hypothetical protein